MQVIKCEQYDDEWWGVRRGVPTASGAAKIITPKGWDLGAGAHTYAKQLVADTFDGDYGPQNEFATAAMRNGTIIEPEARDYYAFQRGGNVARVGFCLTDDGRFGASPDALVDDDGLLEIKSPKPVTHVGYLLAGNVPAEYLPQLHWQLIVTGRKWVDFLSYVPGFQKLLVRVTPNDRTETMRGLMDRFWVIYQEKLRIIRALRDDAIDETIARKGDKLAVPDNLKALVPPASMDGCYF